MIVQCAKHRYIKLQYYIVDPEAPFEIIEVEPCPECLREVEKGGE